MEELLGNKSRGSLGPFLSRRRQELGLSLESVYKMCRIRPIYLEAIETENWDVFLSTAQARAFTRRYAKALGLEHELIQHYEHLLPQEHPRFRPVLTKLGQKSSRPYLKIALLISLVIGIGYVVYHYKDNLKSLPFFLKGPAPEKTSSPPRRIDSPPAQTEKGQESTSKIKETTQEDRTPPTTQPTETPSTLATHSTQHDNVNHTLTVFCNERTWVRVYVDEEMVKEYILNPGDNMTWVAKKGLEIKIGNAGGVELDYNGKKITSLGSRGQVVLLRFPDKYQRRSDY